MALALLALLVVAAAIAVIVVISEPARTRIVLRNVVYSEIQKSAAALKQLVSENTQ